MLRLVANGVPWHVALGIDPSEHIVLTEMERAAAAIIFGIFDGGKWNWDSMTWDKPNA